MLCHNLRLNSDLERSANASIVRFGGLKVKVDISKSYEEDYCTTISSSKSSHVMMRLEDDEEIVKENDCCQIESYDMQNLGTRNIVEESKRPLPVSSILGNREDWNRWVFVTSLRSPLDRAVSLLHSESRYCRDRVGNCSYETLFRDDSVRKNCANDSFCYSNHMTRVFSGRHGTDELTRTDLERAKLMLHRVSCILVLDESLNQTASCLKHTLGLSDLDLDHSTLDDEHLLSALPAKF